MALAKAVSAVERALVQNESHPEPQVELSGEPLQPQREPVFNIPAVVVGFAAICILLEIIMSLLSTDQQIGLLVRGAFIPFRYTGDFAFEIYAVTSPVTYSLLHGGWMHLAVNLVWLAAFGSPLANRIGAVRFVLFWIGGALAAAALHFALHSHDQSPLVGASGSISAMMGAAARFAFQIDRSSKQPVFGGPILPLSVVFQSRPVMIWLGVWLVINFVTGVFSLVPNLEGGIAWEAHVGGLLFGFFLLPLFDPPRVKPTLEN